MLITRRDEGPEVRLARAFQDALEAYTVFAPSHVRCRSCLAVLREAFAPLHTAHDGAASLGVQGDMIMSCGVPLRMRVHGLVFLQTHMESLGLRRCDITAGVAEEELDTLLQILAHRVESGVTVNVLEDIERAHLPHVAVNPTHNGQVDGNPAETGGRTDNLWNLARETGDMPYLKAIERARSLATAARIGGISDAYSGRDAVDSLLKAMAGEPDGLLPAVFRPAEENWELAHIVRSTILALRLGLELTDDELSLHLLGESAFFHDIGFFTVAPEILYKQGALTPEEREAMEQHVIHGVRLLLTGVDFPPAAVEAALLHHTGRAAGGYPALAATTAASMTCRIVTIADAYESMIGSRPHRAPLSPTEAAGELLRGAGTTFDDALVGRFVRTIGLFPVGAMVLLSDGSIGEVLLHNPEDLMSPVVSVVMDPEGASLPSPRQVDLALQDDLTPMLAVPLTTALRLPVRA